MMIRVTSLFTIIAFILTLGLANMYFFEQADAQSDSNSNNGYVNPVQIKTNIFNGLAKCILSWACSPLMGSEGSDRI